MIEGRKKVAIALSGGVDSAVSAFLLKQMGYEVIGLHMVLFDGGFTNTRLEMINRFCETLKIPLHIVDLRDKFKNRVISYFIQEYRYGRTPNPCVVCNKNIKFGELLDEAQKHDADYMATGHYAILKKIDDVFYLVRAADRIKDQTYMLWQLDQYQLSHALFPLGEYAKTDVVKIALDNGFIAAFEKSSQDLCFIEGKYTEFLKRNVDDLSGYVVDNQGNILGKHDGIYRFTIGQRFRGNSYAHERLYVIDIDAKTKRVTVGLKDDLYSVQLIARDINWIFEPGTNINGNIMAQVRYRSSPFPVRVKLLDDTAIVEFLSPQLAITPGQSVVFYKDDIVLGGGKIVSSKRVAKVGTYI